MAENLIAENPLSGSESMSDSNQVQAVSTLGRKNSDKKSNVQIMCWFVNSDTSRTQTLQQFTSKGKWVQAVVPNAITVSLGNEKMTNGVIYYHCILDVMYLIFVDKGTNKPIFVMPSSV